MDPLLVVRVGIEILVEEHRIPPLPRLPLQRQGDQVAESALRQGVLAREEAVVGTHGELVAAGHGLGDEIAAHFPGSRGRNRLAEEEPGVGTVPRTRPFDGDREADVPARFLERPHVLGPRALVEVDRQEPAGPVLEERIDPHHVAPFQVRQHHRVVHGKERLVAALPTLHLRQLAEAPNELVRAGRSVALLPGLPILEPRWEHVSATSEQLAEKPHLVFGRDRHRSREPPRQAYTDGRCGPGKRSLLPPEDREP